MNLYHYLILLLVDYSLTENLILRAINDSDVILEGHVVEIINIFATNLDAGYIGIINNESGNLLDNIIVKVHAKLQNKMMVVNFKNKRTAIELLQVII